MAVTHYSQGEWAVSSELPTDNVICTAGTVQQGISILPESQQSWKPRSAYVRRRHVSIAKNHRGGTEDIAPTGIVEDSTLFLPGVRTEFSN